MVAAIPWILSGISAVGSLKEGQDKASADEANAATYRTEGDIATKQGYEAEAQQRRKTAVILGDATAAAGQSGAGYGGSNATSMHQSAINAELDALNIRYKSQLQKWSYTTQAGNLDQDANVARQSGALKAGAALLKGQSNYGLG